MLSVEGEKPEFNGRCKTGPIVYKYEYVGMY